MEKTELLRLIDNAFKNVSLDDGVGIYEADAIDRCASEKKIIQAKAKDRALYKRWRDIPAEVIETFNFALCFVDAKGMRFLLPAY